MADEEKDTNKPSGGAKKDTPKSAAGKPKSTKAAAASKSTQATGQSTASAKQDDAASQDQAETKAKGDGGIGIEVSDETKQVLWRIFRAVPMIFFGFIAYVALLIVYLLSALQFIYATISGEANEQLTSLISGTRRYLGQIVDYLSYKSDELPFPFSRLPVESTQTE